MPDEVHDLLTGLEELHTVVDGCVLLDRATGVWGDLHMDFTRVFLEGSPIFLHHLIVNRLHSFLKLPDAVSQRLRLTIFYEVVRQNDEKLFDILVLLLDRFVQVLQLSLKLAGLLNAGIQATDEALVN